MIALLALVVLAAAQPDPTVEVVRLAVLAGIPKQGTVLAEYWSEGLGGQLLIGFDCRTRAWYQVYGGEIWGTAPTGEYFTGRESPGSTRARPDATVRLTVPDRYLPTLFVLRLLEQPDRVQRVERLGSGYRVTAEFASGSVMYPPTNPGKPNLQQVVIELAEDGRLLKESNGNRALEHSTDYAPESVGTLPVVRGTGDPQRGWRLTSYTFIPEGDPSRFTPGAVERLAIKARTGTRKASLFGIPGRPTPGTAPQDSGSRLEGNTRWALLMGGLTVLAIGAVAWWRRRTWS